MSQSQYISSVEDPIKFFQAFFEFDYLETLRNNFMPDQNDPADWNNKFDVDFEKETFTVEHLVEVSGHEEDDGYGNEFWVVDETQYESKTYTFLDDVTEIFIQEYSISCTYFGESLKDQPSVDKCKHLCHLWINDILFFIGKFDEDKFIKYKCAYEPVEDLIKHLLVRYLIFCPEPRSHPKLLEIHNKSKFVQTDISRQTLGISFYKTLAELFDEDYDYLVDDDNENIERKVIHRALMAIVSKKPRTASLIIKFNWGSGPVNYLLHKLKQYNRSMNLQEIEKSGKVLIQKSKFTAGASYTAASRFKQNAGNQITLKRRIDELFSSI